MGETFGYQLIADGLSVPIKASQFAAIDVSVAQGVAPNFEGTSIDQLLEATLGAPRQCRLLLALWREELRSVETGHSYLFSIDIECVSIDDAIGPRAAPAYWKVASNERFGG
ncbi:hypothetical protein [uncultured Nitratireductor sp.]|uniref:hypothetical protein n=1 Tax=uncultured Nitratireductor sp. TaxID=520953 RepID=UPI0025F0CF7A|nr:hypothetical protein [uncultured Nitratireductor sp.]